MEIQVLDQAGVDFIIREEGCVLHPYLDQVGIPTIGVGMTYYPGTGKKVTMEDKPLTMAQAQSYFLLILKPYELAVYSTTRDDLSQNQFNALVSLTYNIGTNGFKNSTVHTLVQEKISDIRLKRAFLMWRKAKGRIVPDLVARRGREYAMYIS